MCPFCGKQIDQPQIKLTLGKKSSNTQVQTYFEDSFNLLSAESLFAEVKYICLHEDAGEQKRQGGQISLEYLRETKEFVFWNYLFYFSQH